MCRSDRPSREKNTPKKVVQKTMQIFASGSGRAESQAPEPPPKSCGKNTEKHDPEKSIKTYPEARPKKGVMWNFLIQYTLCQYKDSRGQISQSV